MTTQRNDFDPKKLTTLSLNGGFLAPKYWGTWIIVLLSSLVCFLPNSIRLALAKFMAKQAVKIKNKANRRAARVNLEMCFLSNLSKSAKKLPISHTLLPSHFDGFASLTLKSKTWLENNTAINGLSTQLILQTVARMILLVPHTWAIDIPAVLLASRNLPVSAMAKAQKKKQTQ
ncbi:hypothetical protein BCS58_25160 [Enterovibrio norvegicus]|uniref:LpxL/LpxP family acyltransferase n=1 Tax=Enterovibrio norvegicus TaxID=188144 RepID=UPI00389B0CD3